MAKYNWTKIKTEYVTTAISQRELAKKHGVSLSQLAKRCSKEAWAQQRENHKSKVASSAVQKVEAAKSDELADKLKAIRTAGDDLAELIAKVCARNSGYISQACTKTGKKTVVDTRSLRELTGALKDVLGVIRDVYELPTLKERAKMEQESGGFDEVRVVFGTDDDKEKAAEGEGTKA